MEVLVFDKKYNLMGTFTGYNSKEFNYDIIITFEYCNDNIISVI